MVTGLTMELVLEPSVALELLRNHTLVIICLMTVVAATMYKR